MKVEIIRSYEFSKEEIDKARNDWGLSGAINDQQIAKQLAINAMQDEDLKNNSSLNFRYAR